ncbi:hypothetical protein ACLOJK_020698 [Asimina triloba]
MEQDVLKFLQDPTQQQLEFQHLPTSYLRLAAHRVAQHYCLQSMVVSDNNAPDGTGSKIVVHKTSECQLPQIRLADIPLDLPQEDKTFVKIAIRQRPQKRLAIANNANTHSSKANHLKSVEERKEEYNRARARIFSSSGGSEGSTTPDCLQHSPVPSAVVEEKAGTEVPEIVGHGRVPGDSSIGGSSNNSNNSSSSRSSRSRTEKEPIARNKTNSRVAIFRDREVDRKDPDYDRSYDRYNFASWMTFRNFFAVFHVLKMILFSFDPFANDQICISSNGN